MTTDKSIDLKQSSNNIKSISIYFNNFATSKKKKNLDQFMSQRKKNLDFLTSLIGWNFDPVKSQTEKLQSLILKRERKYINVNKI